MSKRKNEPRQKQGCRRWLVILGFLLALAGINSVFNAINGRTPSASQLDRATEVPTNNPAANPNGASTSVPTRVSATSTRVVEEQPTQTATVTPTATPAVQAVATTRVPEPTTYYVISPNQINVRAEPNTDAELVIQLAPGSEIPVIGRITGQKTNGSNLWYVASFNSEEVYIHTSLLGTQRPTLQPANQPSQPVLPSTVPPAAQSSSQCNGEDDLGCDDFNNQREANAHLAACGTDEDRLDQGGIPGRACESLRP